MALSNVHPRKRGICAYVSATDYEPLSWGLQGVGKSCLVLRYVRGQFDPSSKVTVGAAFMSHSVHLQDGTTVKFEIWCDLASQCCVSSNETFLRHKPHDYDANKAQVLDGSRKGRPSVVRAPAGLLQTSACLTPVCWRCSVDMLKGVCCAQGHRRAGALRIFSAIVLQGRLCSLCGV